MKMTEKEFWHLLGGKELIEMMLDARNFRFYNKSGRYKFLECSGDFVFNDPAISHLEYRVCINQYVHRINHIFYSTKKYNSIWNMYIFHKKRKNQSPRLITSDSRMLSKFLESTCRVTLTF